MEKTSAISPPHSQRFWGLDLLRILAAFTVVVLHVNPQAHLEVSVASAEWNVMNAVTSLCCWNVSAFFMISGALFLSPQKELTTRRLYSKTLLRMVVSFLCWSAFYALTYCVLNSKGKWTFLNQLFRGHYHMWYLFTIISLYWITPLLRKITESKKATEYFLIVGFVFSFLFARILNFIQLLNLPHADVIESLQSAYAQMNPYRGLTALYYYVLGHYLFAYPISRGKRRTLYLAGFAGVLATAYLSHWHSNLLGTTSSVFSSNPSLSVLATTSAIFVFFKEFRLHAGDRTKALILHASKCSFGVYLVHAFVLERLNPVYPLSFIPLLGYILGISIVVFLISYAISAILNRIPLLNKYIV